MSEGARRYFPVSWEELHRDARALSWRLAERRPFAGIVAVTRGGLVPAHIVARELDIRLIDTICVSSYDTEVQRPPDDVGGRRPPREQVRRVVERQHEELVVFAEQLEEEALDRGPGVAARGAGAQAGGADDAAVGP